MLKLSLAGAKEITFTTFTVSFYFVTHFVVGVPLDGMGELLHQNTLEHFICSNI